MSLVDEIKMVEALVADEVITVRYQDCSFLEEDGTPYYYVSWDIPGLATGVSNDSVDAIHDVYLALCYAGYIPEQGWETWNL